MFRGTRYKICKILLGSFTLALFLSSCGGADIPYTLVQPGPPGGGPPPGGGNSPPPPVAGQGCLVTFNSTVLIKAKLAPGASSSADASGLVESNTVPLPPIKLRFNGTAVTMNGDEFEPGQLQLGTTLITVRQKAGTQATGTYDPATGAINLSGVQFEITSPVAIQLPTFSLTTGSTGQIQGDFGNLSEQGVALTQSKNLTLVGGFKITPGFPLPEYVGAAVTITLAGTVDNVPDPATCSGAGSGVVFKELVANAQGGTDEVSLASNNTLLFGNVFVPEQGVDNPVVGDIRFIKTKILRVKNISSSAITANVNGGNGFNITPSGNISIAPNASRDFTINFSVPTVSYAPTPPPLTQQMTTQINFGGTSATLSGVAKRAGPELVVEEGTETNDPVLVNLGTSPFPMQGSGAATKLLCSADRQPPFLVRKVLLRNGGVRPLNIQSIQAPVDTDSDNQVDPFCVSWGREFQRMGLAKEGNANCQTEMKNGHSYIKDNCTLPNGNGKIKFHVVYLPKNASTAIDNSQDTGTLTVTSNDPLYTQTPFVLNLRGAVSRDTSDLLSLNKMTYNQAQSRYDISTYSFKANDTVTLNIPQETDTQMNQAFVLRNSSTDTLQNVQLTIVSPPGGQNYSSQFEICSFLPTSTQAPATALTGCATNNAGVVSQIPPAVGLEPGKAYFGIRFKNPPGSERGPFAIQLKVNYIPSSTPGVPNEFKVNLLGTVEFNPLTGRAELRVEFISIYISPQDEPPDILGPTNSVDFRATKFKNVRSGPLHLKFTPEGVGSPIYDVEIVNPVDPNNVNELAQKNLADRKEMIRLPSDSFMECPGNPNADCSEEDLDTCRDPAGELPVHYVPGDCSYFYYAARQLSEVGKFNYETGQMILPNIQLHLFNPYHKNFPSAIPYLDTFRSDTLLQGSFSTFTISSRNATALSSGNGPPQTVPLVTDNRINSLGIPAQRVNDYFPVCPANWANVRLDDYGSNTFIPSPANPTPEFSCYLAPRPSTASLGYLRGYPAVPAQHQGNHSEYSIVISMVSKFNDNQGPPEYIPFIFNDGVMWVAIQGRLRQCDPVDTNNVENFKGKCRSTDDWKN